jgi:hypothetical protein
MTFVEALTRAVDTKLKKIFEEGKTNISPARRREIRDFYIERIAEKLVKDYFAGEYDVKGDDERESKMG